MHHRSRLGMLGAAVALSALVLTACSGTQGGGDDDGGDAATGGTLKLAGNSDVLYLDPAASY